MNTWTFTWIRYNTFASEHIPSKIGLRIEIMCLQAVQYRLNGWNRFNSITCFLFTVDSALTAQHAAAPPCRWSHFFLGCSTLYTWTEWPGRTRGRESSLFHCAFARPSDADLPIEEIRCCTQRVYALEEREKFSKAMTSLFERCDMMRSCYLTSERIICLLRRNAS